MTSEPLLTIAIPTWNRAPMLALLLKTLVPQIADRPEVELLICDNGSTDDTAATVKTYATETTRYHRHPENLGSDANFVSAFELARGRYFWLCGDDDLVVPNAVYDVLEHLQKREYDLVYATSYGYRIDWRTERVEDPLGREYHTIVDPVVVARVVNVMFTFISGIIVNRRRLLTLRDEGLTIEGPAEFVGTNLTQLAWTLPLLRRHRQSLVLWRRPIACRLGHNGGYDLASIFGEGLQRVTQRCLPDRPDLSGIIVNTTLRRWFPSILYDVRSSGNDGFAIEEAQNTLRETFGKNPRYWLFTYPVLVLPLPLAKLWMRFGALLSKVIYCVRVPGFWRKRT